MTTESALAKYVSTSSVLRNDLTTESTDGHLLGTPMLKIGQYLPATSNNQLMYPTTTTDCWQNESPCLIGHKRINPWADPERETGGTDPPGKSQVAICFLRNTGTDPP